MQIHDLQGFFQLQVSLPVPHPSCPLLPLPAIRLTFPLPGASEDQGKRPVTSSH